MKTNAIGKSSGTSEVTRKDKDGNTYKSKSNNVIPKFRYKDIIKGNPDGKKIKINKIRDDNKPKKEPKI